MIFVEERIPGDGFCFISVYKFSCIGNWNGIVLYYVGHCITKSFWELNEYFNDIEIFHSQTGYTYIIEVDFK